MNSPEFRRCPVCKAPVEWGPGAPFRPFCSERCKLVDLGAWANETYRIPAVDPPDGDEPLPPREDA
jgi:endogenous inhibitor of DNA gyrase (YacG/DUF329 family)